MNLPRPQHTILVTLGRFGCLSAEQLTNASFGRSDSFVREQCAKLYKAGYLNITPLPQKDSVGPGGRPLRIYSLKSKGRLYLSRQLVTPIYAPSLKSQYPLRHALRANSLVIFAHQLANRVPGYQLVAFQTEFDLKARSSELPFVPDGFTHLLTPNNSVPIVWEADLGTETRAQIREKITKLAPLCL